MAKPLHDWNCIAHGHFESRDGRCPHGCGKAMVQKVFLKAPGMKSDRTKNIDSTIRGMAAEHGLTDVSNRGGDPVRKPDQNFMKAQANMDADMRAVMEGRTFAGQLGTGENAITKTMQEGGFASDNAIKQVQPMLAKPKVIVHASYNPKPGDIPKGE